MILQVSSLNFYNLTLFDASNADGYCYVWDKTYGCKGNVGICSCLLMYLNNLPESINHVSYFSDICHAQNRSVTAVMLFAGNKNDPLEITDLQFVECSLCSYFYLEADSMYSTVEYLRRHKTMNVCSMAGIKRDNIKFAI